MVHESMPAPGKELDRWIEARRGPRNVVDPQRPYAFCVEPERARSGEIVEVATVFLTNRECPWRCLMCDLWQNTTETRTPVGAIPGQIETALRELGPAAVRARHIKLYNSGSFFDPGAIPPEDHAAIATAVRGFEHVIVESHPRLIDERARRFSDRLDGSFEVAIGLETVHPEVLRRLNKGVTLDDFKRAAGRLQRENIDLRLFVLVKPPFLDEAEALEWACRSIDFAFELGAGVVSLIPTRGGNGAMDALADAGDFAPPRLATLRAALDHGLSLRRGRVFVDLWDLDKFSNCPECLAERRLSFERANFTQVIQPAVTCERCGE